MRKGDRLRARILRFLSERERVASGFPELQEIAEALGDTVEDIRDQIDILESKGALQANRTVNGGAAPRIMGLGKALLEEMEDELEAEEERLSGSTHEPGAEVEWDAFIAHASEDKEPFVQELAGQLTHEGVSVWYDEFALTVGDSLRRSIDKGLARSRYGIVVLRPNFFLKEWPQQGLDGLAVKENAGQKVILPIWLNVERNDVAQHSPTLADRVAAKAADGSKQVVADLKRAMGYEPPRRLESDNPVRLEVLEAPTLSRDARYREDDPPPTVEATLLLTLHGAAVQVRDLEVVDEDTGERCDPAGTSMEHDPSDRWRQGFLLQSSDRFRERFLLPSQARRVHFEITVGGHVHESDAVVITRPLEEGKPQGAKESL